MSKKILIIDDDADVVSILQFRLEKLGFEIELAKDGATALEKVKTFKPDLMFIDVNIPEPNGLTITQSLKKDPQYQAIQIILISGAPVEDGSGADLVVLKPYEWDVLHEQINKLLGIQS